MIDNKKVQEHFDKAAENQSNSNAVLDSSLSEVAAYSNIYRDYYSKRNILKNVAPDKNDSVLDFGCGVGRLSFFLSPYVQKITGVDVSEKMIQVANGNNTISGNTTFFLLNSPQIPVESGSVNKIISNWVFQHISDDYCKKYLEEFNRVLSPGGEIFLFEQIKRSQQTAADIHIFRTVDDYRKIFADAGFKEVYVKRAMRVPSRGMSLWNQLKINNRFLLWLLSQLDDMTMNRKPDLAEYFTYVFVFRKT